MASGERVVTYPDGSLQKYFDDHINPGRLIWAFVPHVDLLPTAILPHYRGECYTVHRSKKRPVLIIGSGGATKITTLKHEASLAY